MKKSGFKNRLGRAIDMFAFKRILKMGDDNKKSFYNMQGCGLEIEFGVKYQHVSSRYIKTGLEKLKKIVGEKGKFVPDITINNDFNIEIVLMPLQKDELKELFLDIKEVINFYENFVCDENCGVHATFLADEKLKEKFYNILVGGGYDSSKFLHNKYKIDFLDITNRKETGEVMTYEDYINYQQSISGKYTAVNFLKPNLVEFRALDMNWENIEYVYDLFELASSA